MTILVFCEHDVPDHVPERLAKAEGIGAIPINFMEEDPVASIMKLDPNGVDRSCDCVGFECVDAKGENGESTVITWAVNVTRAGGGIGLIGVYDIVDNGKSFPQGCALAANF
jgi:threonine dehydrogenase-like Zn-dependent dehydrogenase